MAAVNLFEAAGLVSLTVDALAWFNLAGALAMGFAWPLHEAIVQRRAERQERQDRGGNGRLVPES